MAKKVKKAKKNCADVLVEPLVEPESTPASPASPSLLAMSDNEEYRFGSIWMKEKQNMDPRPDRAPSPKPEPVSTPEPVCAPESLLGYTSTNSIPSTLSTIQRPRTSPYSSSLITLHIGPNRKVYYVPQDLLQYPGWISSCFNWGVRSIELSSMDEDTGHVLVHYLYTGAYQTLDNTGVATADEGSIEFKRAILAYFTAKTYKLHNLQRLAMEKIEHIGMGMNIFQIFEAIDHEFTKCPDKTGWFHDYLKKKAKATFEEDHTLFAKDAFLDRISNVDLNKILVKCVVEFHTTMISRIPPREASAEELASVVTKRKKGKKGKNKKVEEPTAAHEPAAEEPAPVEESPPAEESACEEAYAEEPAPADEPAADEPAAEEPAAEEPAAEEPAAEEAYAEEPAPAEEPAAEEPAAEEPAYEEAYPEEPAPADELAAEEAYAEEPAPAEEPAAEEPAAEEPAAEEPAYEEPYPEEPAPSEEPAAEELVCEELAVEEPAAEEPACGEPYLEHQTPAEDLAPELDYPEPGTAPPSPISLNSYPECEVEAVSECQGVSSEPCESTSTFTESVFSVESESGVCSNRVKHLLDGDMWKDCRRCRAMIRQVAIQLARPVNVNEDGYETVDRVLMR